MSIQDNATYVRFVHACLGYPSPTSFLNAVSAGYTTGPDQFPRLTTKMIRMKAPSQRYRHGQGPFRPNSIDPTTCCIRRRPVSARRRHHNLTTRKSLRQLVKAPNSKGITPFAPQDGPRSTVLHLDYTGPLPDVCCSGTRYFQISCNGGYINIQPLVSLRHEHTTAALKQTVGFFRSHAVKITEIRMDNQQSQPLTMMAKELDVQWNLVSPYVKNPNRAERAIRTAKNHLIATQAGFHPDCPPMYLDK